MNQSFTINSLQDTLMVVTSNVLATLIAFVPQFLGAIIVFLIGVLLSRWAKILIKNVLQAINLTAITKNTALQQFMDRAEIRVKIEELIGELVRWLIMYIFLIAAVNVLGLVTVSDFLTNILSYVPRVISASLIFALGVLAAGFTEGLVKSAVTSFDITTGRIAGKAASYTVVIFASLVAIGELGIAERFINTLFIGFVAMISIGMGLAFGLGAKDVVNDILREWYKDLKKDLSRK